MLESQTAESLRTKIKEAPHWRVTIRPGAHVEERIRTLGECWRLVETSRVSLRGWDYPHLDYEHRQYGNDWVASWDEYRSHREYWRLYQSGQFLHLFSFKEDHYREEADTKAKSDVPALSNYSPSGYLGSVDNHGDLRVRGSTGAESRLRRCRFYRYPHGRREGSCLVRV